MSTICPRGCFTLGVPRRPTSTHIASTYKMALLCVLYILQDAPGNSSRLGQTVLVTVLFRYMQAQSVKTGLISDLISILQLPMFTLVIMHDTGRINLSCLPEPEDEVCMFTMMCSVFLLLPHTDCIILSQVRANLCNAKSSRQSCNTDTAVIHDTIYYISQRRKKFIPLQAQIKH